MKIFVIALALATLFPGPADSPTAVVRATSAPVEREAPPAEPPAWLLALSGVLAIALMRRPLR